MKNSQKKTILRSNLKLHGIIFLHQWKVMIINNFLNLEDLPYVKCLLLVTEYKAVKKVHNYL